MNPWPPQYNDLIQDIRKNLTPDLLKPEYKDLDFPGGHCYISTESLYHSLGGQASGLKPMRLRMPNGTVHWWLEDPDGNVLDATHDQFSEPVPYDKGRSGGFLTKEPSKRTQELIQRLSGFDKYAAVNIEIHRVTDPQEAILNWMGGHMNASMYFNQGIELGAASADDVYIYNAINVDEPDEYEALIGSIIAYIRQQGDLYDFDAAMVPNESADLEIYVDELYVKEEYRKSNAFFKLIQPLQALGLPINATFENKRLENVFEKLKNRGELNVSPEWERQYEPYVGTNPYTASFEQDYGEGAAELLIKKEAKTTMYHVSAADNYQSIMDRGLEAQQDYSDNSKRVYLMNTPQEAIAFGVAYKSYGMSDKKITLFAVDVPKDVPIKHDPRSYEFTPVYPYYILADIPADHVHFVASYSINDHLNFGSLSNEEILDDAIMQCHEQAPSVVPAVNPVDMAGRTPSRYDWVDDAQRVNFKDNNMVDFNYKDRSLYGRWVIAGFPKLKKLAGIFGQWQKLGADIQALADRAYDQLIQRPDIQKLVESDNFYREQDVFKVVQYHNVFSEDFIRDELDKNPDKVKIFQSQNDHILLREIHRAISRIRSNYPEGYKLMPNAVKTLKTWMNGPERMNVQWNRNPGDHVGDIYGQAGTLLNTLRQENRVPQGMDANQMSFEDLQQWLYDWQSNNPDDVEDNSKEQTVFELPDKWRIVRITEDDDLAREGELMGHCLPPDAIVSSRTPKTIESIEIGDEVLTHTGQWKKVLDKFIRPYKGDLITMHTKASLPLKMTPEHQVLILRPIKTGKLKDRYISNRLPENLEPIWIPASDLELGDYLLSPIEESSSEDTDDVAWLYGFFAGDGWSDNKSRIGFVVGKNNDLDRVIRGINQLGYKAIVQEFEGYYRVRVNSAKLSRMFAEFGKRTDKHVPANFITQNPRSILAGLLESDGCYVADEQRWVFTNTSEVLCRQVWQLAMMTDARPSIRPIKRYSGYDNAQPQWKVEWKDGPGRWHSNIRRENFYATPITKIEYSPYEGLVYNLEVEEDHSYLVNGLVTHNCVGGYCRAVQVGSSLIYSLRDPKNEPHATIEIEGQGAGQGEMRSPLESEHDKNTNAWQIVQIQGKSNQKPIPEYVSMIRQWFESLQASGVKLEHGNSWGDDEEHIYNIEELAQWADSYDENNNSDEVDEYGIPKVTDDEGNLYVDFDNLIEECVDNLRNDQDRYRRNIAVNPRDLAHSFAMALFAKGWTGSTGAQSWIEKAQEKIWESISDFDEQNWEYISESVHEAWKYHVLPDLEAEYEEGKIQAVPEFWDWREENEENEEWVIKEEQEVQEQLNNEMFGDVTRWFEYLQQYVKEMTTTNKMPVYGKVAAPRVLYHVAPPERRNSIEMNGLDPHHDQTGYRAIYLSREPLPDDETLDTYRVYTDGLKLRSDESTPGFKDWYMTHDVITPDRIELLDPAELQYVSKWNKVSTLEGLPQSAYGPHPAIQQVAQNYMTQSGLPYDPPQSYQRVDPQRAKQIAELYDKAEHRPFDPEVKRSYQAMIDETKAQYDALVNSGFNMEFYPDYDPYLGGPREALDDIHQNNHLYVYPTSSGFGADEDSSDHPLLQDSGIRWNDKPVTHNDLFRGVHDFFGHAKEGVGFRADGEENAWRQHSAMYSPTARPAMTAETRGQNSFVNFGPFAQHNREADQANTIYADQKATVLPSWVTTEGAHDDLSSTGHRVYQDWTSSPIQFSTTMDRIADWESEGNSISYPRSGWRYDNGARVTTKIQGSKNKRGMVQNEFSIRTDVGSSNSDRSSQTNRTPTNSKTNSNRVVENSTEGWPVISKRDIGSQREDGNFIEDSTTSSRYSWSGTRQEEYVANKDYLETSHVNYGPYAEQNRQADQENTVYADQKATVLPHWVTGQGADDRLASGWTLDDRSKPYTWSMDGQGNIVGGLAHEHQEMLENLGWDDDKIDEHLESEVARGHIDNGNLNIAMFEDAPYGVLPYVAEHFKGKYDNPTSIPVTRFTPPATIRRLEYNHSNGKLAKTSDYFDSPLENPINYQFIPFDESELAGWNDISKQQKGAWNGKANRMNNRAINLGAQGSVSGQELWTLNHRYQGRCAYDGKPGGNSIDHVIPLRHGGPNTIDNMLPCHVQCNSELNNMDLHNDPPQTAITLSPKWLQHQAVAYNYNDVDWKEKRIELIALASQYGIEIHWGGMIMDSYADLTNHYIQVPKTDNDLAYAVALHEIGHAAFHQQYPNAYNAPDTNASRSTHEEEYWVDHWVLEHATIPLTQFTLNTLKEQLDVYEKIAPTPAPGYGWLTSGQIPSATSSICPVSYFDH